MLLEVGRIGKAHGVRGDVIVHLLSDRTERMAADQVFFTEAGNTLTVASARPHQRAFIVTFVEVDGRNGAEALRGELLRAESIDDPDVLWVHDLIGRPIVEVDGTDRGVVVEVHANPASDLLISDQGFMIPLAFLVDHSDQALVIDPPAGLFAVDDDPADHDGPDEAE